jgi:two-component system chemotaxis response regulator CheB
LQERIYVPNHDVIVIGGSAGASRSLRSLLHRLPRDLPASIFVVLHLDPSDNGLFASNLSYQSALPVEVPGKDSVVEPGRVYVCRADHHLIVQDGRVRTVRGPRENLWRPSIDVLFRSAAVNYGSRVIAVLLSGELDDGTAGMGAVKTCGGITVLQDIGQAEFTSMLRAAADEVAIDHEATIEEMPPLLRALVDQPAPEVPPPPAQLVAEAQLAEATVRRHDPVFQNDDPSVFSCPECGGPLWPSGEGQPGYRCLVGHAFNPSTLLAGTDDEVERTVWAAIRLFEQRLRLEKKMAKEEGSKGHAIRSELYAERAAESEHHARMLRELLEAARSRP